MPLRHWPGSRLRSADRLRIDRYLHCIRLVKSRTLAQALIGQGHVRIDGKRITRPSEQVQPGSVVTLPHLETVRVLRVVVLPERRGSAAQMQCAYEELGDEAGAKPSTGSARA